MKNLHKNPLVFMLAIVLGLAFIPTTPVSAAESPELGTAEDFSVLASPSMSAASTGTTVSGNLGLSVGLEASKTGIWTVEGAQYFGASSLANTARTDALSAFNNLAGQGTSGVWGGAPWSPAPGVWTVASDTTFTGTITLDGEYGDVWIFQVGRDMVFSGSVIMAGTAQPCNVFWQIGRDATIASGSEFVGTLIALRDITVVSNATVDGRILSLDGALTTDRNNISGPTCEAAPATGSITITKTAVGGDGTFDFTGTGDISDFSITTVSGTGSRTINGLDPGTYAITEDAPATGWAETGNTCASVDVSAGVTATCGVTNTYTASPTTGSITITKTAVGGNGTFDFTGTGDISDFSITTVSGTGSSTINGLDPGTYAITEAVLATGWAKTNDTCASVDVSAGVTATCGVTNTYTAARHHSSGLGGSYVPPVPPIIDVVKIPSPLALPDGPGLVTYTYTLRNIGTVPVTDITMIDDSCDLLTFISGDDNTDSKLDLNEEWIYRCSATLSKTHTNTVVATGMANGLSATDIASATVIVGASVVPPLIHVTKVPSPLALFAGGGVVTYTETITNPGTEALSNIRLTDDKCGPMNYVSGDANGDSKLDTAESWIFTCQSNLVQTTTNTAVAEGSANGLTAKDFAIVTVVVAIAPALPNTGLEPGRNSIPWGVIPFAICAVLAFFYLARGRQTV